MTSNPEQTMEEIAVSYDVTDEMIRDVCKAARIRAASRFGYLALRLIGFLFVIQAVWMVAADRGVDIVYPVFLIVFGLFFLILPFLGWRVSYSRSKRLFDRAGVTSFNYRFGGEKILMEAPNSRSEFTYKHATLAIRHKKFLLMFMHNTFYFVPGNLLTGRQMEMILDRFRDAGVKVRA